MVFGPSATVPVVGLRLWLIGAALVTGGIPCARAIDPYFPFDFPNSGTRFAPDPWKTRVFCQIMPR